MPKFAYTSTSSTSAGCSGSRPRRTPSRIGAIEIDQAFKGSDGEEKPAHEFSEFEVELNQLIRKHFPHWGAKDLLG
ncbi:hypothetical protein CKO25_12560 [Thiocapsa imhoffii]|uniref:Sulfate adenylyltransferase n=1 Tax=Thiocapsa imhoffii TaxID=382777 RepID=A0A9X0WJ20_9GAMM|nr:hypothetical protein [Thiocapsa imhoffii]